MRGGRQGYETMSSGVGYQTGHDEAIIHAKPPYRPDPDVDARKERHEAKRKQRYCGPDVNSRQVRDVLTNGKEVRSRRGWWRGRSGCRGSLHSVNRQRMGKPLDSTRELATSRMVRY